MQCRISEKIGIQAIIIRILLLGGIHWFVSSESRQLCSFDHVFYVPPLIIVWSQKVIINRSSCVLITHINHVLLFSNHDLTLVVTLRNEILTIVDFRIIVIWKEISLKTIIAFLLIQSKEDRSIKVILVDLTHPTPDRKIKLAVSGCRQLRPE